METTISSVIQTLGDAFETFFSFKAYVILPVFMLILACIARMKFRDALTAAIRIAAGFAGIFVVFNFFVSQIGPVIDSIIARRGLEYPVMDIGWPPLAAITWSSALTPIAIVLVMLVNMLMLATRATKNLYIDLWNYWHFAFLGVLIQTATGSLPLGLASVVVITIFTVKMAEWSAPYVKRSTDLDGIAVSPLSVAGLLPWAVSLDALFDRIPFVRSLDWNPSSHEGKKDSLLGEPMVIGFLVGAFLSALAGYGVRGLLETSVNIAAVMFLLPKCGALIGDGMGSVSRAFKTLIERRFPSFTGLSIAMDTGFLLTNPSVIATGLILMPVSLALAFILPGNRVLPVGDLPNLISVFSLSVLIFRGNVVRSVIAGIPVIATFLWFSSSLAPVFTAEAQKAGMDFGAAGREITAFTDGGNQIRFWFYHLFRLEPAALAAIPFVAVLLLVAWRAHRKTGAAKR